MQLFRYNQYEIFVQKRVSYFTCPWHRSCHCCFRQRPEKALSYELGCQGLESIHPFSWLGLVEWGRWLSSLADWALSFYLVPGLEISYSCSGFLTLHPFDVSNPSTTVIGIYCWSPLPKVTVLFLLPVFFRRRRRGDLWWSRSMLSDKLASGSGPEAMIRVRHGAMISQQVHSDKEGPREGQEAQPAGVGQGQGRWRRVWDQEQISLLPICKVAQARASSKSSS